ncbi:Fumarylpyruvate hydrolase [Acinetobacter baumannii]|nr:Fumarylpyruvate hydrolase [Acinetobacter baumannii]
MLFIKPPSSLIGLDEGISWNPAWGSCHFECEFVLRIDQPLKGETDPQKVLQAIGAVTLGLDLTLRDLQNELKDKGQPWERAKAFDGSCVADWVDGVKSRTGKRLDLLSILMMNYVKTVIPLCSCLILLIF